MISAKDIIASSSLKGSLVVSLAAIGSLQTQRHKVTRHSHVTPNTPLKIDPPVAARIYLARLSTPACLHSIIEWHNQRKNSVVPPYATYSTGEKK